MALDKEIASYRRAAYAANTISDTAFMTSYPAGLCGYAYLLHQSCVTLLHHRSGRLEPSQFSGRSFRCGGASFAFALVSHHKDTTTVKLAYFEFQGTYAKTSNVVRYNRCYINNIYQIINEMII